MAALVTTDKSENGTSFTYDPSPTAVLPSAATVDLLPSRPVDEEEAALVLESLAFGRSMCVGPTRCLPRLR
jgi:hypothetical protein